MLVGFYDVARWLLLLLVVVALAYASCMCC
jgi:hypothetical protein